MDFKYICISSDIDPKASKLVNTVKIEKDILSFIQEYYTYETLNIIVLPSKFTTFKVTLDNSIDIVLRIQSINDEDTLKIHQELTLDNVNIPKLLAWKKIKKDVEEIHTIRVGKPDEKVFKISATIDFILSLSEFIEGRTFEDIRKQEGSISSELFQLYGEYLDSLEVNTNEYNDVLKIKDTTLNNIIYITEENRIISTATKRLKYMEDKDIENELPYLIKEYMSPDSMEAIKIGYNQEEKTKEKEKKEKENEDKKKENN